MMIVLACGLSLAVVSGFHWACRGPLRGKPALRNLLLAVILGSGAGIGVAARHHPLSPAWCGLAVFVAVCAGGGAMLRPPR